MSRKSASLKARTEKNMSEEKKGLAPGLVGEAQVEVTEENTALRYGSGLVPVFATPAMVGLMEGAAVNCAAPYLEEGTTTVGTRISVSHAAATPVGLTVRAEATLTGVDGRRLIFAVKAWDDRELIGEGDHERFIIKTAKFIDKANAKAARG